MNRRHWFAAALCAITGCASRANRLPFADRWFMPIVEQYHVCDRCGSLDGGIYGKGPWKGFRTEAGRACVHEWRPITREEFRALAVERFGIDWSKEIPWWFGPL